MTHYRKYSQGRPQHDSRQPLAERRVVQETKTALPPGTFDVSNIKSNYYHSKFLAKQGKENPSDRSVAERPGFDKYVPKETITAKSTEIERVSPLRQYRREMKLREQDCYKKQSSSGFENKLYSTRGQPARESARQRLSVSNNMNPTMNPILGLATSTRAATKTSFDFDRSFQFKPTAGGGERERGDKQRERDKQSKGDFFLQKEERDLRKAEGYSYQLAKMKEKERSRVTYSPSRGSDQTQNKIKCINKLNAQINQRIKSILQNFKDIS